MYNIAFINKSETSDFTKKKIFEFNLNSGLNSVGIGPGDSCLVSPCIYNSSTEEMYVFIKINMPKYSDEFLYSFEVNDDWSLVKEEDDGLVYAYGNEELIKLFPGEETESLTNQITFRDVTNAEFYEIADINISISGYAIEVEGSTNDALETWETCLTLINN